MSVLRGFGRRSAEQERNHGGEEESPEVGEAEDQDQGRGKGRQRALPV
jgi:hypothetical protein